MKEESKEIPRIVQHHNASPNITGKRYKRREE